VVFQLHLDTETVGHIDLPSPFCVTPDASVREVLEKMKEERRGSALICRNEKLVGIFTERDSLYLMASNGSIDCPIEEVMNRDPETIFPTETVQTAISKMSRGGYRRLPVVDEENRPIGLLKVTAILHYLVQHFPKFVYNLPPSPDDTTQQREGA
jgi:CBS domain-containing protein